LYSPQSLILKRMKWRKKWYLNLPHPWLCRSRSCLPRAFTPALGSAVRSPPFVRAVRSSFASASPRTPPHHLTHATIFFLHKTLTRRRLPPTPLAPSAVDYSQHHHRLPRRKTPKLVATSLPLSTAPRAAATTSRFLGSLRREDPYPRHHGPCGGALLALQAQPSTSQASFREVISSTLCMKSIDLCHLFRFPHLFI
jgi:hypothetical protein